MSDATSLELRDLLASHALGGLLTAPSRPGVPVRSMDEMAKAAYQYADAMLKARQQ